MPIRASPNRRKVMVAEHDRQIPPFIFNIDVIQPVTTGEELALSATILTKKCRIKKDTKA